MISLVLFGVVAYGTLLYALQRPLLFPRPRGGAWPARPPDARQLWLNAAGGRVEAWYLPPIGPAAEPAPLLIYLHGNGEVIDLWPGAFDALRRAGVALLLVEYPGYGRSEGSPSERSITEAVGLAFDRMLAEPGVDPKRIVAYGRSVGGGAACALARRRPVAALILESTFTSVRDLAYRYAAPGFLVRDRFDNRSVVRHYGGPILILHGTRDGVIPVAHGRRLAAEAPRAELHLRPHGHDDGPSPWEIVLPFLARHGLTGRESTGDG